MDRRFMAVANSAFHRLTFDDIGCSRDCKTFHEGRGKEQGLAGTASGEHARICSTNDGAQRS
ncbi:MAG: hypothetical protein QNJ17_09790 [Desulfocapsaceae bacterium]|nr:hypothetical protein [Desulfocapsaceae bacterium]